MTSMLPSAKASPSRRVMPGATPGRQRHSTRKVSARAAGLKVGFIKPESALTVAKRAWKKMTPE